MNDSKIKINYVLRGDIEAGHDICIQNLSGKPVILEYMEIFGKNNQWPVSKNIILWHPEDSLINSKIEPRSSKCFYFNQADYFSFGKKPIYVRLNFAGRKSIIKKIK